MRVSGRRIALYAVCGALLVMALSGCARNASDRIVSLVGPWAFQPGDDLSWSVPAFDDSSWPRLHVPMSWGRQGFDRVEGFAWYRLRVAGPWPPDEIVGVLIGKVESAYDLYVGGRRLGGVGKLPPDPREEYDHHTVFTVTPTLREPDGSFVVAMRVWRAPNGAPGAAGPTEGPYAAGPLQAVVLRETRSEAGQLALVFVFLVAAFYHLCLRGMRPATAEYGWFGLLAVEAALYCFLRTQWKYEVLDQFLPLKKFEHLLLYLTLPTFIQFIWVFFREPLSAPLRVGQGILLATGVVVVLAPGLDTARQLLPFLYLMLAALMLAALRLVISRIRAGDRDARLVGLSAIIAALAFTNDAIVERNFYVAPRLGVYGFAVLVLGMSMTLAYRFQRALNEVESLRLDLEARVSNRTHELSEAYRQLQELALRDGLTGLLNRRAVQDRAMSGLAMAKRKNAQFALAMVDIDHFKLVNDTHGHAAGDQVLAQLAQRLTSAVRASDDVGRWGGEEFLVLFPESDRESVVQAAERLRAKIASEPLRVEGDVSVQITVSIGVAVVDEPAASPIVLDALIRLADGALYRAKDAGRNRVVMA